MRTSSRCRAPRRAFSILATLGFVVFVGLLPSTARAASTETIVLFTSPPSWGPDSTACPEGLVMGSFTTPDGQVGRILSCVQSIDYRGSKSWVEHTNLTFVLPTGHIETIGDIGVSSSTDGDYLTLTVKGKGTVTGGTGHYASRVGTFSNVGTFIVGPDGVTGSVTFTITLS